MRRTFSSRFLLVCALLGGFSLDVHGTDLCDDPEFKKILATMSPEQKEMLGLSDCDKKPPEPPKQSAPTGVETELPGALSPDELKSVDELLESIASEGIQPPASPVPPPVETAAPEVLIPPGTETELTPETSVAQPTVAGPPAPPSTSAGPSVPNIPTVEDAIKSLELSEEEKRELESLLGPAVNAPAPPAAPPVAAPTPVPIVSNAPALPIVPPPAEIPVPLGLTEEQKKMLESPEPEAISPPPPPPPKAPEPALLIESAGKWMESHEKLMALFQKLRGQEGNIHRMLAETAKAKPEDRARRLSVLYSKYPGLFLFKNFPFDHVAPTFRTRNGELADVPTIETAINHRITLFKQIYPDKCVVISSATGDISLAPQSKVFAGICESYGLNSKEPGKLFVRKLTDKVEMTEKIYENPQEFSLELNPDAADEKLPPEVRQAAELWYDDIFYGGMTLSALGVAFGSNTFISYGAPKWLKAWKLPSKGENPRTLCLDSLPPKEEEERLYALSKQYSDQPPLRLWRETLEQKKRICGYMIGGRCDNTRSAKGTRVYSYQTAGCQIRDVTKKDLKEEIEAFELIGQKAPHAGIVDTLSFCDEAEQAGYKWAYNRPVLTGECAEKKARRK